MDISILNQKRHLNLDRWDVLLTLVCFGSSLLLYCRTLTPGLLPGDSGEFQTLAYLLGHTHPTGYPVYLVLAKLATLLPWGDVAYRVNLFSALMASSAVAGVYLTGRVLVNYRLLSFLGAIALAVSPTFWSQAIIAEVYTAGAAFLIFILLLLLMWDQNGKPGLLFLAGLLGGLSLGIHMSVELLAPAILIFLVLYWQRGKRTWEFAFAGAVTGVIVTIAIFGLMDLHNPAANYFNSVIEPSRSAWGLAADEIDGLLERLFFGWSARQFHSFMFSDIIRVMPYQAAAYWKNLPLEFGFPIIWLAVLGAVALVVRRMKAGIFILTGLVIQLFCMFNYEIWDLYVFYIPSYVFITIFAIAGMGTVIDLGITAIAQISPLVQKRWSYLALESMVGLLVLGFALWPIYQPQNEAVLTGDVPFNMEEYPVYDDLTLNIARAMVINLPEDSIVFADWDMIWPYYYAAHIVEDRRDLMFIETYPADDVVGVADSVAAYVAYNIDEHPIFFTEREQDLITAGFKFTPVRIGQVRLVRIIYID